jgi:superfamily II DNA/RNA helicase
MRIDFSKLNRTANKPSFEPRDIFMALPYRSQGYGYPRDVQTEAWEEWFAKRNERDVSLTMEKGSGKTIVGLLILLSCLAEGKGPALNIVSDKYKVSEVSLEARKIGFNKKGVLIADIRSLVGYNAKFGSIVADDAELYQDKLTELQAERLIMLYSQLREGNVCF